MRISDDPSTSVHLAVWTDGVCTWLPARIITLAAAAGTVPPGWRALLAMEDGTFRVADLTECRHELDSDAPTASEVVAWREGVKRLEDAVGPMRQKGESAITAACRLVGDMDIATRLTEQLIQIEAEKEQLIAEATQLMEASNAEIARLKAQLADALPKGRRMAEEVEAIARERAERATEEPDPRAGVDAHGGSDM